MNTLKDEIDRAKRDAEYYTDRKADDLSRDTRRVDDRVDSLREEFTSLRESLGELTERLLDVIARGQQ
jgi:hypothetical protein